MSNHREQESEQTTGQHKGTLEPQLALQTVAMPKDANAAGDIFGGWLVSQMDLAGSVSAGLVAQGRVATVAIDNMVFIAPVSVGASVSCYTRLQKVGRTSMTFNIEVWTSTPINPESKKVADGIFTFVAMDKQGKPRLVPNQNEKS